MDDSERRRHTAQDAEDAAQLSGTAKAFVRAGDYWLYAGNRTAAQRAWGRAAALYEEHGELLKAAALWSDVGDINRGNTLLAQARALADDEAACRAALCALCSGAEDLLQLPDGETQGMSPGTPARRDLFCGQCIAIAVHASESKNSHPQVASPFAGHVGRAWENGSLLSATGICAPIA